MSTATKAKLSIDFHRPQRFIDVGDSKLAYWKAGSGPDLLFLHGWPLHSATYRNIIPLMAQNFTCHCIDFPGVGHSTSTEATPFTLRAHAQATLAAIKQLGLTRFGIVAHDSGAVIGRYVAESCSSALFGMVMGNSEIPHHHPPMLKMFVGLSKLPGGMSLIVNSIRLKKIRHSNMGFGSCFVNKTLIDGEFYDWFIEPLIRNQSVRQGQSQLLRKLDLSSLDNMDETHSRIQAPVLLIWGTRDFYFPVDKAKTMLGQFGAGASMVELEQGSLFCHEEFPSEFARHANHFFNNCLMVSPKMGVAMS